MPLSTLQYARQHGLAVDHRNLNPTQLLGDLIKHYRDGTETLRRYTQVTADDGADEVHDRLFNSLLEEEKMTMTMDQALRLQHAIRTPDLSNLSDTQRWHLPNRQNLITSLKLETPLLVLGDGIAGTQRDVDRVRKGIDIDATVRSVKAEYQRRTVKPIEDENSSTKAAKSRVLSTGGQLPTLTDDQVDHGIQGSQALETSAWIAYFEQCSDELWQQLNNEKLKVKQETLLRLQRVLERPSASSR